MRPESSEPITVSLVTSGRGPPSRPAPGNRRAAPRTARRTGSGLPGQAQLDRRTESGSRTKLNLTGAPPSGADPHRLPRVTSALGPSRADGNRHLRLRHRAFRSPSRAKVHGRAPAGDLLIPLGDQQIRERHEEWRGTAGAGVVGSPGSGSARFGAPSPSLSSAWYPRAHVLDFTRIYVHRGGWSAGRHRLRAYRVGGGVLLGDGQYGQLGDGTTVAKSSPTPVLWP